MKRLLPCLLGCTLLTLAACSSSSSTVTESSSSSAESSSSESSSVRETPNVSYQGIVEPAGIGIAMQGTHQLHLSDGRIVLLESMDIDLNGYLGKKVGIFGATRPTVEGNGIIMRVNEVILLEEESSSSSSMESLSSESLSTSSSMSSTEAESRASMTSSAASLAASSRNSAPPVSSSKTSSSIAPSTAPSSQAGTTTDVSINLQAHVDAMAKDKMDAGNWTQQYCTAHIGFCIPIHRNWWFKSFGTTSSSLWHVEISNADIENLGDGPITVKLLSGSVDSKKATDGQVRVQGDSVIGFRAWGSNEHFEITAPLKLQAAVSYLTVHLTASTQ